MDAFSLQRTCNPCLGQKMRFKSRKESVSRRIKGLQKQQGHYPSAIVYEQEVKTPISRSTDVPVEGTHLLQQMQVVLASIFTPQEQKMHSGITNQSRLRKKLQNPLSFSQLSIMVPLCQFRMSVSCHFREQHMHYPSPETGGSPHFLPMGN